MYKRREEIQAESSLITSKVGIMEGIPQIVMVMIYGSYSDEMGRKLTIMVPYIGGLVLVLCTCLMISLDLPLYTYYIGSIINGISGSYGTMLSGVFSYLADTTTKDQRSLAIGMMETSVGLSVVISNFGVGYWLKASGPKMPSIAFSVLLSVSPIFIFCVKESVVRTNTSERNTSCNVFQSLKKQFKKICAVFTANKRRGLCLALCIVAFAQHMFCVFGSMGILTLYALNEPFCWTSDLIGFYSGSKVIFWQLGMAITLLTLRRRITDWSMVYMAYVSYTLCSGLQAAASLFVFPIDDILMISGMRGRNGRKENVADSLCKEKEKVWK